jgi:integrase
MLKKLEAFFYKQKNCYWAFGSVGSPEIGGKDVRVRKSLGTDVERTANERVRRIIGACEQGAESKYWQELRAELPPNTFKFFADMVGYKDDAPVAPKVEPTWAELLADYTKHLQRPIVAGKRAGKLRADSTKARCLQTFATFTRFLTEKGITNLVDITPKIAQEQFQDWRIADLKSKSNSRKLSDKARLPGGYILDVSLLCSIFKFAVEQQLITKSPFRSVGAPGADPENGAQPFTKAELDALVRHAGVDLLLVLIMLRTGLRRSDAIRLQWRHVGATHIALTAQKNGNKVRVPMSSDLSDALAATRAERFGRIDAESYAHDFVLLNPYDGKLFANGKALHERVRRLGQRAGVKRAHPHRFRDSFAKDCFLKGCSVAEVAAYLGDKPETVSAHYSAMDEERMNMADKKFVTEGGLLNSVDFSKMGATRKLKVVAIGGCAVMAS